MVWHQPRNQEVTALSPVWGMQSIFNQFLNIFKKTIYKMAGMSNLVYGPSLRNLLFLPKNLWPISYYTKSFFKNNITATPALLPIIVPILLSFDFGHLIISSEIRELLQGKLLSIVITYRHQPPQSFSRILVVSLTGFQWLKNCLESSRGHRKGVGSIW